MAEHTVESRGDGLGDDALEKATRRRWEAWFEILDAEQAAGWKHPQIARWLAETHGVDGWWSQGITVGYEQARGIRAPGQRSDGTYEVSTSRTYARDRGAALEAVIGVVSAELGTPPSSRGSAGAKYPTARWKLEDGTFLLASVTTSAPGKTGVALTWGRLKDAASVAPAKERMRVWLLAAGHPSE